MRRWSSLHRALYRLTGGRIGNRLVSNDMLLLTTRGHVTGRDHTIPLLYLRDGDRLVVIASYGGRPGHPTWYHNLVADPVVLAQVDRTRTQMLARTATAPEHAEWWPRVVRAYPGYADYQSRTERQIPVVLLEPRNEAEGETR